MPIPPTDTRAQQQSLKCDVRGWCIIHPSHKLSMHHNLLDLYLETWWGSHDSHDLRHTHQHLVSHFIHINRNCLSQLPGMFGLCMMLAWHRSFSSMLPNATWEHDVRIVHVQQCLAWYMPCRAGCRSPEKARFFYLLLVTHTQHSYTW